MNNKGSSIIDVMFITFFVLSLAATALVSLKLYNSFDDKMQTMDVFPAEAKAASTEFRNDYPTILDNMFLFATIGLSLAVIISAFRLETNPVFLVIFVLLLMGVVITAAAVGNAYDEIGAFLSVEEAGFRYLPFIMNNWAVVILIVGVLTAIALYSKSNGGGGFGV